MSINYIPKTEGVTSNYYMKGALLSPKDKVDPKKVGVLFESLFYQMMLKEARNSKLEDSPFDNKDSEFYKEMWDNELSMQLAERGELGIVDMVSNFIEEREGGASNLGMLKDLGGAK